MAASRLRVVDTRKEAEKLFKTFHARNPAREVKVKWTWPRRMREAGVAQAEMYESNKWKLDLKEFEDYKHVADGPRLTYVRPNWLREFANPNKRIPIVGEEVTFKSPMPKHFAILGPLIAVQLRLFEKDESGKIVLPKGKEEAWEVRLAHGMLGGARHPETEEPFLFVYTRSSGIGMIITGDELEISKDGIAG
jgi:hypothetical protein